MIVFKLYLYEIDPTILLCWINVSETPYILCIFWKWLGRIFFQVRFCSSTNLHFPALQPAELMNGKHFQYESELCVVHSPVCFYILQVFIISVCFIEFCLWCYNIRRIIFFCFDKNLLLKRFQHFGWQILKTFF